ncbi:O-methyltransferase involved in polyketide biosynthesis [Allocatelliglobosispora scoriae]|uniref:O-methyltransferase involved in polyketide biosynthesis n=1 Tax=Allocatelliglobosispora scoriae TaxID=643052 RepID=A0A841BN38_9ACTN|nr:SAM-dependent methyltransferase [Allocatelliglobosispora scoriae]MBB5868798.1 O-methyltransferase involved in polyketide biosynthesis [Allocatelliglobosispora scoriae]
MESWNDWAPDGLDTDRPNVARIYDYYLGGSHNYPVDREMARHVMASFPDVPTMARLNRAFLERVVRHLVASGVRQFIDLGSGLPTAGSVHEIAQRIDPEARVVYVDSDDMAVLYSRVMLVGNPHATVVHADVRNMRQVLHHRDLRYLIDFTEPVAVLLFSVLHFITDDDDPQGMITEIGKTVASGSYLAISHASRDGTTEDTDHIATLYARSGNPMALRSGSEIGALFDCFPLIEPGLVALEDWRPDPEQPPIPAVVYSGYGGVGRKM